MELQPGVAEVIGPGDQPTVQAFGAVLSKTGDAARLFVVFRSDPLGAMAIKNLRRLQRGMPRLIIQSRLSPTEASYAGDTALVAETIDETVGDIGRVAPLSLFVVLLVLVLFLRALVAPLYLLATSVLALVAALDARDNYSAEHSEALVDLTQRVAHRLGLDEEQACEVNGWRCSTT